MDNENKDELFSLKLGSEGISHLQRFARVIRIYLIVGSIFILLGLVNEVLIILETSRGKPEDWLLRIYFSIYPLLMIIGLVIFVFQLIYFRRLSVMMEKAVSNTDEFTFNAAFENLSKIAWVVICNALLAIVYASLNLAVSLRSVF